MNQPRRKAEGERRKDRQAARPGISWPAEAGAGFAARVRMPTRHIFRLPPSSFRLAAPPDPCTGPWTPWSPSPASSPSSSSPSGNTPCRCCWSRSSSVRCRSPRCRAPTGASLDWSTCAGSAPRSSTCASPSAW